MKDENELAKDCYENMSSVPTSGFLVQQVTNGSWLQHLLRDLFARRRDQKMNELLPGGYILYLYRMVSNPLAGKNRKRREEPAGEKK